MKYKKNDILNIKYNDTDIVVKVVDIHYPDVLHTIDIVVLKGTGSLHEEKLRGFDLDRKKYNIRKISIEEHPEYFL